MKLKKLFAGVVAVAMMATMAMPSFAANRTAPNVGADGLVTITKKYTVTGSEEKKAPAETFTFTVTPGAKVNGAEKTVEKSEATTIPAMAANSNEKTVAFTALTEDGTGTFTVDVANLNITKPGMYYYTVTETPSNTAGVDYAAKSMIMVITAGYADDGEDSSLSYWAALHDSTNYNDKNSTFENTYTAGSLKVTKKVTGSLGDKDKKFKVDVTFTAPADKTVKSTITYVNNGEEKSIAPAAWTLDTTTNRYKTTVTVELAHKGSVQFNNIPKDVTYIVEEQDYSREEYTATYEEDSKSGTIANDVKSTTITNKRGDDTIDTGVILDNAPYILMLAVVAGGAMMLVIKKRREEE